MISFRKSNAARPRLRRLFTIAEEGQERQRSKAKVVIVPDFEVDSATSWQDESNKSWLETRLPLMFSDRKPCVLSFEPGLRCDNGLSWQHVSDMGDALLHDILHECRDEVTGDLINEPLFILCHGMGGLILKRALVVLYEGFHDPYYRAMIASIAAVVFLGCPSPKPVEPADLHKVSTLLAANMKKSNSSRRRRMKDVTMTAILSQKFSDMGFEPPVLSVYERKFSKVGKHVFSQRQILVDKYLCETMAKRERLVGIDSNHGKLCNVSPSSVLEEELKEFFALAEALWNSSKDSKSPQQADLDGLEFAAKESGHHIDWTDSNIPPFSPPAQVHSSPVDDNIQPPRRLPCHLLGPARTPDLFGREDILTILDESLLPSDNLLSNSQDPKLRTFALCGLGGVGKSSIAAEFVHTRRKHFDAIFWVNAADRARLVEDFTKIAIELGLENPAKCADHAALRKSVLQWLSSNNRQTSQSLFEVKKVKWLLVFDNADSLSFIRQYWPIHSTGSILITSRDPLAKSRTYFHSPKGLDLEPLRTADSATWLRKLTGHDMETDVAPSLEIVEKLSNLPLAISNVAGGILRQSLSLTEFLEFYIQESFRAQLFQWQYKGEPKTPIWTVFALQKLSPEATALLHTLCFLSPDAIPEYIFLNYTGNSQETESRQTDSQKAIESFRDARTELISCSLLRRRTDAREITIHRIIQDYVISSMDSDGLMEAFRSSLRLLSLAWPFKITGWDSRRYETCQTFLPHVSYLLAQYQKNQSLLQTHDYKKHFGKLLLDAGWYQVERGDHMEALPLAHFARTLLESLPATDNLLLSHAHHVLKEIWCCNKQDRAAVAEARRSYEYIKLVDFTKLPSEAQIELRRSHNGLGRALIEVREYAEALEHYKRAINLTEDPSDNLRMLSQAGKAICIVGLKDKSKYEETYDELEMALVMKEQSCPGSDSAPFLTGLLLLQLGNIRVAQNRHDEALELHLQTYKLYVGCLNRDHYRIAGVLANIGTHYLQKGDLIQAKKSYLESLSMYGKWSVYTAETTWTSFQLLQVLESLSDPSVEDVRKMAHQHLLEFSLKLGRRVVSADLTKHLASWAMYIV